MFWNTDVYANLSATHYDNHLKMSMTNMCIYQFVNVTMIFFSTYTIRIHFIETMNVYLYASKCIKNKHIIFTQTHIADVKI